MAEGVSTGAPPRIAIIGGGVGGLACAWRLSRLQPTAQITVLESSTAVGGTARTQVADGLTLELGPDSLLRSKPAGMALVRELGLESEVIDTSPEARSSLIARGQRLLPVPEGLYLLAPGRIWPFVWSRVIGWRGKLRMLRDLIIPPAALEDETLGSFVRRRLGQEALDRLAQPLVSGIYTADPERLSLRATMPQFLEMERTHGSLLLAMRARMRDPATAKASGPRYSLFASLRGGLGRLPTELAQRLSAAGVAIRCQATVTGVRREDGAWRIAGRDAEEGLADQVVVAGPAWLAAAVLRDVDASLSGLLAGIPYAGVATVNLVFRRDQVPVIPQAAGFVIPAVEGRAMIACTFSSRKYPGRNPDDQVVLRAFVGGALHAHHLERDDQQLIASVQADLRDLLRIEAAPLQVVVTRWPRAMAQYHLGHIERVAAIRAAEATHPGLALVGNGYEGVGIPDVIAQADAAARRLCEQERGSEGAQERG